MVARLNNINTYVVFATLYGHISNANGMVIDRFDESKKHIFNCSFGILANFDVVLRNLSVFFCAVLRFRTPLTPPSYSEKSIWHENKLSVLQRKLPRKSQFAGTK